MEKEEEKKPRTYPQVDDTVIQSGVLVHRGSALLHEKNHTHKYKMVNMMPYSSYAGEKSTIYCSEIKINKITVKIVEFI